MKNDEYSSIPFTDEEVEEQLLDAIIIAGCHEYLKNYNTTISDEKKAKISFSDKHRLEMKRFFNNFNKSEKKSNQKKIINCVKSFTLKACVCVGILFVISAIVVTTSEAARVKFLNAYIDVFEIKTDFSFTDDEKVIGNIMQRLEYIPTGFTVVKNKDADTNKLVTLEYGEYFIIINAFEESEISIDTENAYTYEKVIGDYQCFVSEKDNTLIYLVYDKSHGYIITSNYDELEIEKLIENLR